jgi:hypothetical protein
MITSENTISSNSKGKAGAKLINNEKSVTGECEAVYGYTIPQNSHKS